ncbi:MULTISPECIES: ParB/RepB/Spo0J family partition protein [unclassified Streptomyces]|uniref:ParB/RepB/Spo0J family partition protein n=1 Tax=unclassified Streptomyces TaxID=2593676 RepID=UPI00069034BF|nr:MULTISPECIES: ParB/RepB/Spo0J family partition protein [unclassified Streptomyces]MCH0560343.1 ParB/RepB/Spo0J family partition protein [Streptomyces sp. MUM 16J]
MRNTNKKDGQPRVTRGFSIDDDGPGGEQETPRRIRTRSQIMNGEGKRPPASVKLALLAHNPFNPREELTNLEETADSLWAKGQIQPVTVARRAAFLTAHPGQEDALAEAEYVVIDGNRRLAAAHLAGLEELRIDVNDDLAASAADLLESALIANIHREDVAPLDQAKAIQDLVKVHGSQGEVARRLGKTPPWVSQRLALLELTPELQEQVETGELKVEPARRIGRLPKAQQAGEAKKVIEAAKAPRQRRKPAVEQTSDASTVNAVNTSDGGASAGSPTPATVNAVNTQEPQSPESAAQPEAEQPGQLPYDDALSVVTHLHLKMKPAVFADGARVWLRILREQHPEAYSALLQELPQQEQQPA